MSLRTFLFGWLMVLGLLVCTLWMSVTCIMNGLLLLLPLLLWFGLVQYRRWHFWLLVTLLNGYLFPFYMHGLLVTKMTDDPAIVAGAIVSGVSLFFLLIDMPFWWKERDHVVELITLFSGGQRTPTAPKTVEGVRTDFLHWWSGKTTDERQRVWLRLTPQERQWVLDETPESERSPYLALQERESLLE